MADTSEIKCYTCKHRHYTDWHGYNQYCEDYCGDGDCYKAYEPEEEEGDTNGC